MPKEEIKISVIIPVYNTSKYLESCLDSVVSQSLTEIEIIIVNDCSTDNSQEIIDRYGANDSRFKSVIHRANKGLPSARNSGVSKASGKYIIHLDSDDSWISNNVLQILYDTAEEDGCDVLRFNGMETGYSTNTIFKPYDAANVDFFESPDLWKFRSVFLFLFRKDFLDINGFTFNPKLSIGEDAIYLSLVLPKTKRISSLSTPLYAYTVADSSMMRVKWSVNKFLEEQKSARETSHNLLCCKEAWLDYWQYRLDHYWPRRLMKRALKQLNVQEVKNIVKEVSICLSPSEIELLLGHPKTSHLAKNILTNIKYKNEESLLKIINDVKENRKAEREGILYDLKEFVKRYKWLTKFLVILYFGLHESVRYIKTWCILMLTSKNQKTSKQFSNIEKNHHFDTEITSGDKTNGVSAMLRVKNEEEIILDCLRSIIFVFDEIVVVDNNSTDLTVEKIAQFQQEFDCDNKIKLLSYPFSVSRCGQEHQNTPSNSLHSLAYYYNWSLSKCSRKAVFKWDADMILSSDPDAIKQFTDYLKLFSHGQNRYGSIAIQTLYIDKTGKKFLSKSEINSEIRIFKNYPNNFFDKDTNWEVLKLEYGFQKNMNNVLIYEVKDVRKNEFTNWSTKSFKTKRKVREFRNYLYVQRGHHNGSKELFESIERV